jgi:lipopolysaccharide assembly outer membrane protein LptD (OstA)
MLCAASFFLAPALGQTQLPGNSDRVDLTADKVARNATLLHGAGHARATIGDITVAADDATLHSETGELELRGHVHATLPARADHSLFRYGTGNLLTDQPVGLTADRMTIKNGLLQASGNIVVVPVDPELPGVRLHGDEMFMYLRSGDATLRGNVQPIHIPERQSVRFGGRGVVFPPEIIK